MKPDLETLCAMAHGAGEIIRAGFYNSNNIKFKGEIDVVTEVDTQTEAFLLDQISRNFPDHAVIAEESGGVNNRSDHSWYLDPIDGTTNYVSGLPIFAVSIGYLYQGRPTLGVVYNPIRDELFSAQLGAGAWLNGKSIHASAKTELSDSLLVTGFPYDRFTNPDNNLENFSRFALQVRGVRRLGSAALDLCSVAAGRVDGYWEIRLEPWDLAAGILIAAEAGAIVTKRDGNPDLLTPPCSVVAANPELHQKILDVLKEDRYTNAVDLQYTKDHSQSRRSI